MTSPALTRRVWRAIATSIAIFALMALGTPQQRAMAMPMAAPAAADMHVIPITWRDRDDRFFFRRGFFAGHRSFFNRPFFNGRFVDRDDRFFFRRGFFAGHPFFNRPFFFRRPF